MTAASDPADDPGAPRRGGSPSIIAHRGFAGVYPENTLAAVRRAAGGGPGGGEADTIEIDLVPTADGEVVVFHDRTLSRLTDATGDLASRPIWEVPSGTLRGLEVLDSGESIPTLAEALAAIPPDVRVNLEFKNPGTDEVRFAENLDRDARERQADRWLPFAERVFEVADGYPHDLLVSSFYEGAIAAAREVAPEVPVGYIFWDSVDDGLAVARRHDCEAIHPPMNMIAGTSLFNDDYHGLGPFREVDLVAIAAEEGRAVNAWTLRTWHQARELSLAGVDGLVVDYPGLLRYGASGSPTPERA